MDDFERFLFSRINDFENRIKENSEIESENKDEILWALNCCVEELLDILSNYNLNYKILSN